ncbi:MAG: hypothetical protein KKG00_12060 [Bacteroidetes bacterium]|nr:hypothetical protein [Bacteroidota bacterium]
MDRRELDKQTKATRSTKNILYWIVGVGLVLIAIAFFFVNPGGSFKVSNSDSTPGTVLSDTLRGDVSRENMTDTLASDIRED